MTKPIEVDIYGQRLVIQGEADEVYAQELARFVEGEMHAVAQNVNTTMPAKIAILAAINITDQLFQQQRLRQAGEAEVECLTRGMMEAIEAQL